MSSAKRTSTGWRIRKAFLQNYIRANGYICQGFERPPHQAAKLEVDHLVPLALGGSDKDGLRVLCPGCNRSRGGRLGNEIRRAKEQAAGEMQPVRRSRVW